MKTRIRSFGDRLGVIVDRGVLELLGMQEGTQVDISTDGEGLIIRAIEDEAPPPPPQEPVSEVEIVVTLDGQEVKRVPLDAPSVIIGRDARSDVYLDDRSLSRRHAKIERRGAAFWVADLGSVNKTYLNGARVDAPKPIAAGDEIAVGRYRLQLSGVEEAEEDMPVLTLDGPDGQHRFGMVGDSLVLGRSQDADIHVTANGISRRHLRVRLQGRQFVVEDLGSQNGTTLNGKRITKPVRYKKGDVIGVVDYQITLGFLADEEDELEEAAPMAVDRSMAGNAAYLEGEIERLYEWSPQDAGPQSAYKPPKGPRPTAKLPKIPKA